MVETGEGQSFRSTGAETTGFERELGDFEGSFWEEDEQQQWLRLEGSLYYYCF